MGLMNIINPHECYCCSEIGSMNLIKGFSFGWNLAYLSASCNKW